MASGKLLWDRWAPPLGMMGVADPKHALHMCHHAEFGRSASKGVGIIRGESKIQGALIARLREV